MATNIRAAKAFSIIWPALANIACATARIRAAASHCSLLRLEDFFRCGHAVAVPPLELPRCETSAVEAELIETPR
jgi:hypothetical protein